VLLPIARPLPRPRAHGIDPLEIARQLARCRLFERPTARPALQIRDDLVVPVEGCVEGIAAQSCATGCRRGTLPEKAGLNLATPMDQSGVASVARRHETAYYAGTKARSDLHAALQTSSGQE
jgi:hypothetical protein